MKKRAGVGNLGTEEVAQTDLKVLTRARTRAEAESLFSQANVARAKEQRLLGDIFVQTPGAETMSPMLAKTAAIDAFFEKISAPALTEAQRRYPELLKVAAAPGPGTRPSPTLTKRTVTSLRGATPTQSSLSGGAA
jgi:hypothetical protein